MLMEYLGTNLKKFFMDGEWDEYLQQHSESDPATHKLLFALDCIDKVNDLHKRGFVHCDIKPDNFLFKREGKVGVNTVDFGFSQKTKDWKGTSIEHTKGSHQFNISPEEVRRNIGEKFNDNFFMDIYALGVMLSPINHARTLRKHWNVVYKDDTPLFIVESELEKRENIETLVTQESSLFVLSKNMCADDPMSRPNLEFVKVAFLAEIFKDSDDKLTEALEKYDCVEKDPIWAKSIHQVLTDRLQSASFIQSCNYLQASFNHDERKPVVILNSSHWQQLLLSKKLQKRIINEKGKNDYGQDEWRRIVDQSNQNRSCFFGLCCASQVASSVKPPLQEGEESACANPLKMVVSNS